jgi:hypothetical protein
MEVIMTLLEMYQKTKAWMFEKPSSTIYDNYIVQIANKVLAETYEENNMLRMFKGKLPFIDGITAHQVSSLEDELDYEEEYLLDVIPKGIDANFLMDDDLSKMGIYQTEYNNARVMRQVIVPMKTVEKLWKEAEDANS